MPTLTTTGKRKLKINKLTKTQMNAVVSPSSTELYCVDPEFTGGKLLTTDANGDIVETNQTIPTVDQIYDSTSANAQSGVAVASAISGKQEAITSTTVTLTSAGWSSNTQTVSVTGMTASSIVWVSPAGASMSDYASAGVYCSAQASGTLTFTCSTAPSSDLTVQIVFG